MGYKNREKNGKKTGFKGDKKGNNDLNLTGISHYGYAENKE